MPYANLEDLREHMRLSHIANRERNNARSKAWRLANPERHRALSMAWEKDHPEHVRTRKAAWAQANPEKVRAAKATYYLAHKDEIAVRVIGWRKKNLKAVAAIQARRRALRVNAPVNDLTDTQWQAIKAHYGNRCVYCGWKMRRLTQDHITALSQGGAHTLSNVVPACRSCNSKKGTKNPLVPIQPLLLL